MISIYTSLYNVENGLYDWQEALENFSSFAEEVVIGTTTACKDETIKILTDYVAKNPKLKLVSDNISFDDPSFDGKLKNLALKSCTQEFCMLLDIDERVRLKDKFLFNSWANMLNTSGFDAVFVPVLDIYGDKEHATGINQKWYLHKNLSYLNRGVVNFANKTQEGKFDITRSDSTELIDNQGNLVPAVTLIPHYFSFLEKQAILLRGNRPFIFHIGGLDKEKRQKQDKFWEPVWRNRALDGKAEKVDRESKPVYKHNLGWWQ